MTESKYPSEIIDLPSKGWFYPEGHPLSSGKIDVFYMTAHHEDILTSRNLIQRGVVIDKLLEALIANPKVKYEDLLIGDKNALMIASRILGYGKNYEINVACPSCEKLSKTSINLEEINDKEVDFNEGQKGTNEFTFVLPICGKTLKFKLLTHGDEKSIDAELAGYRKSGVEISKEVTTRMCKSIVAIDGDTDRKVVRDFVETMPARDAKAFRDHARKVNPDIDLSFDFMCSVCGYQQRMEVPIDFNFFWPNAVV